MTETQRIEPFLFSHATPRTGGSVDEGYYCSERLQWVVPHGEGHLPLVEIGGQIAAVSTKTMSQVEKDDKARQMLAIQTKTDAQLESEDKQTYSSALAVQTKTKVNVEGDDTAYNDDMGWL